MKKGENSLVCIGRMTSGAIKGSSWSKQHHSKRVARNFLEIDDCVWPQFDKVQSSKARCHPTSKLITPCFHTPVLIKAAAAGFNPLLSGVSIRANYSNKVWDSPQVSATKSLPLRGEMVRGTVVSVSSQCDRLHFRRAAESGGRRAVLWHISRLCSYRGRRNARPTTETGCCPPSGDLRLYPHRIPSLWFQKYSESQQYRGCPYFLSRAVSLTLTT